MQAEELEKEKKNLIEELGVHMEEEHLAPLAARILSTLILSGRRGVTFDELVTDLHAGKSTISSHLDYLQQINKVSYFTKPGERKRYFIVHPNLMTNIMDEMLRKWERAKQIHIKISEYKQKCNELSAHPDDFQYEMEFQKDYLTYLNEVSSAVKKFKEKLSLRSNY